MLHSLGEEVILKADLDQVWRFFSNPSNLKVITPPELDFVVRSAPAVEMYAGMIVEYTVRPLLKIPVRWVSEITQVRPQYYFVDEQRIGPYRFWHHEHMFEAVDQGVKVKDVVTYALYGGWLAEPIHSLVVRPQLARIFSYRRAKMYELFGNAVD